MKNNKTAKFVVFVCLAIILISMTVNAAGTTDGSAFFTNIPDSEVDKSNSTTPENEGSERATGAAEKVIDDASGMIESAKNEVDKAADEVSDSGMTGVVIAILAAVAVIVIIIVMVSKNGEKRNRK